MEDFSEHFPVVLLTLVMKELLENLSRAFLFGCINVP